MKISTCCGCETDMTEIGICPECLEHCDWEDEEELEAVSICGKAPLIMQPNTHWWVLVMEIGN